MKKLLFVFIMLVVLLMVGLLLTVRASAADFCGNTVTFFPQPGKELTFTTDGPGYIICRVEYYDPGLHLFKTYSTGDGEYTLTWAGPQTVTIRTEQDASLAKIYSGVPPMRMWLPLVLGMR